MVNNDKIQQQIEDYLNQDMSDLDRSRFEKLIHDNHELHEEVELQQSVMEAIRNERMLALKAGLNQVNISLWSTSVLEFAKIAAITAGLGMASVGGYLYFSGRTTERQERVEKAKSELVLEEKTTETDKEVVSSSQTTPTETAAPTTVPFVSRPENGVVTDSEVNKPIRKATQNAVSVGKSKVSKGATATGQPEVEAREPGTTQINPSSAKDIAIPGDGISNKTSLESLNPEVVIKRDNKDKFHYQFSDSKLILYADFSDKLYEVLELNQNDQRKMFFAYDNQFFILDPTQTEISPLKEVKDLNLIDLLKNYQKRKN